MIASETESLPAYSPNVILADLGWSIDTDILADEAASLPELGQIQGIPTLGLIADASQAATAWRAGYRSLLLRSESPRALVSGLHATADGLWVLSPKLSLPFPVYGPSDQPFDFEELTGREQEVLELLAEGLTNRGIAHRLGISEHTVKFHVNSILGKLGADSRTDAVVRATRAGLILL